MLYPAVKVLLSALLIVLVSEVSKRSSLLGAVFASLPLVSILAMVWLWIDTRDAARIATLSTQIFWLVLPSLILFLALPLLLKRGLGFPLSLGISAGLTVAGYGALLALLRALRTGV